MPATLGESAIKLALHKLDDLFKAFDKPKEPGCVVAVLKNGKAIYQKGYGSKRLGVHDPINPRTVFNIGSVSKQFTAFCVLLLQDEGRLNLEDSACKHFPEWPKRFSAVRLRHLMHHSSGLPTLEDLLWSQWKARPDKPGGLTSVRLMARQSRVNFEPGGEFCYNNDGYLLLAEIVRRRSGLSLARFAQERIFKPLGMVHTRFREDGRRDIPDQVQGYRKAKGKLIAAPKEFYTPGSGDVWTTVEDLAQWERNFFERVVGSPALFRTLLRPARYKRSLPGDTGYGGGLVFWKDRGRAFVGHNGGDTGALTEYFRLPEAGLAVICATNREDLGPPSATRVFEALFRWKPRRLRPRQRPLPRRFHSAQGVYENDRALWHVQPWAAGIEVKIQGSRVKLFYVGQNAFMRRDDPFNRFQLKQDGRGTWSLSLFIRGKLRRRLRHLGPCSDRIPGMRGIAGTYTHPESGYVHQLKIVGSRLHFVDPHWTVAQSSPLESLRPDHLVLGGVAFLVERDQAGRVIALDERAPGGRNQRLRLLKMTR